MKAPRFGLCLAGFVFCGLAFSIFGCTFKSKLDASDTIYLAIDQKLKGLDPIYSDDIYDAHQVSQAYEGLLQYHYLNRPYSLVPNLAQSLPEVSHGGKVYTFHLKRGVLFQDDPCFKAFHGKGREMVAQDVAYSLKRLADPKLASSGWWLLDGKIVGLNEWREKMSQDPVTDYSRSIEGIQVLDRYTLQIKLVRPSAQFLYVFAMPFTSIVPREGPEVYGRDFINHAVGTGPYRLSEYNPNSKIVWMRNPTYREEFYPFEGALGDREAGLLEDAGKRLPLANKVSVSILVERHPMWLTFLSGKLDLAGIPKDNFQSVVTSNHELADELKAKGIRLTTTDNIDVTYVAFNMEDPLLGKNKYLRQALSLAYDSTKYIDLFYNGRAVEAQGPLPPGVAGYDVHLENPYRKFSVLKAKEMLVKAGFPNGKNLPELDLAATADSLGRQTAEYFVKSMEAVGVKVKVSFYSWPQFVDMIKSKRAQLWEFAWVADYPDAENFLQLFYSKNASPGPNGTNYANRQFDELYEESLKLSKGASREELYRKMVSILIEDAPWIPKTHRMAYGLVQPWMKNVKPHMLEHSKYKYYRIDAHLRK